MIVENSPVKSMMTFQVRFHRNTPYVHLDVFFDDNVPEKTAFDPQVLSMERPTKPPPDLQKNFYFTISDQALSTDVDLISVATLDDIILEFPTEIPVNLIEMKYSSLQNQNQDLDDDSFSMGISDDDDNWYQEKFDSFRQFDDDMSPKKLFSTNYVHSTPTINNDHSEIPTEITINSTSPKPTKKSILLPPEAEKIPSHPKTRSNGI